MSTQVEKDTEKLMNIYREALPRLLETSRGKHVIVGMDGVRNRDWNDYEDALTAAYDIYGEKRFLVMKVRYSWEHETMTRNFVGAFSEKKGSLEGMALAH